MIVVVQGAKTDRTEDFPDGGNVQLRIDGHRVDQSSVNVEDDSFQVLPAVVVERVQSVPYYGKPAFRRETRAGKTTLMRVPFRA